MGDLLHVLLVEDSEDDALLLVRELKRGGYELESVRVETAEAMSAALGQQTWDLVISDYRLPNFSAPSALALLQESGRDIPFIIVSGAVSEEDAVAAMKAGAHDYITKGKLARLVPVIARELREAEQRRERRQLRQEQAFQSQKLEIIGRLAGGVVHDFNNLLTAISGHAELGSRALATGQRPTGNLAEIKEAVERATLLTRQLLTFARGQAVETSVIDLNELVRDILRLLQRLVGEDIELVTFTTPDLKLTRANSGQCQQVLLNLVVNARDAMPVGGKIEIRTANVTLEPDGPGGALSHYVTLSVTDCGPGIPDEVKAHLFEQFFTTKPLGKGTGLGLSTCQDIVSKSGGFIDVQSEVGHGATFTVYLPQTSDLPAQAARLQDNQPLPPGNETVLLAEDEIAVRGMVATMLKTQGYTVLQAANGEEALHLAQAHPEQMIHLLLTDVVMPRMGGIELAERFSTLYPAARVLFTSGYTPEPVSFHGMAGDDVPFIQKPFLPSDLVRKVRQILTDKAPG